MINFFKSKQKAPQTHPQKAGNGRRRVLPEDLGATDPCLGTSHHGKTRRRKKRQKRGDGRAGILQHGRSERPD